MKNFLPIDIFIDFYWFLHSFIIQFAALEVGQECTNFNPCRKVRPPTKKKKSGVFSIQYKMASGGEVLLIS